MKPSTRFQDSTPNRQNTFLLAILATVLVGWVLHVGSGILQPLVIALLLATMLQPLVLYLRRWKIPPAITVVALATLLFFGLARLGIFIQGSIASFFPDNSVAEEPQESSGEIVVDESKEGPLIEESLGEEAGNPNTANAATQENQQNEDSTQDKDEPDGMGFMDRQQERTAEAASAGGWTMIRMNIVSELHNRKVSPAFVEMINDALGQVRLEVIAPGVLGGGIGFLRGLTLVVIYMLFIFAEQAVFRRKILAVAGERRDEAAEMLDTMGKGIQKYLGVKTVVSLATGALCFTALMLLEIPYAPLFGFLTFLLNYIPTFGSIIASFFPTATALAMEGGGAQPAIIVMVVYLAVNFALGNFIEPKILGRELNLSPLVIIISVVVWAGLWGVVGTFLAVPLTSSLQIILASREQTRPIAMLMSIGPPKEEKGKKRRGKRKEAKQAVTVDDL